MNIIEASHWGHLDVVKELIKAGADVNDKDNWGETALHRAIRWGHLDVVEYLKQIVQITK